MGGGGETDPETLYSTNDAAFTDLADGDYIPVYDTSASAKKKTLWSNVKTLIQNALTGAISSVLTSNLTASRALVSNASGKIGVSAITATKLGYLTDVTSNIQAQLNSKATGVTNYSTSEQDTGMTWINGKKIYQKTINIGNLPNNTKKNVAHGISNLKAVIDISGYFVIDNTYFPIQFAATNAYLSVSVKGSNIELVTNKDYSSATGYVTLLYILTS